MSIEAEMLEEIYIGIARNKKIGEKIVIGQTTRGKRFFVEVMKDAIRLFEEQLAAYEKEADDIIIEPFKR